MQMLDMQHLKWFDISVFIGYNTLKHVTGGWFVLHMWKIAWSVHWECSEIARLEFNNNLLPEVDEKIMEVNFLFLYYGASGIVTLSVFATTFRPTTAYSHLHTMKHILPEL
jgi:hypothetical protein